MVSTTIVQFLLGFTAQNGERGVVDMNYFNVNDGCF
jgi:hypothetical protein